MATPRCHHTTWHINTFKLFVIIFYRNERAYDTTCSSTQVYSMHMEMQKGEKTKVFFF
jgi:hypothetical protein